MDIVTRLDNNQLKQSTDSSKNEETNKPEVNPDPEPSLSDSSAKLSSDSRAKKKKSTKKKKRRKHQKDDSSDPSSSNDYRRKQRKNKKHQEKDLIRLCATLTAKLLTTAYKSKITRFKMDEDQLQRQIYFLKFLESFEMIFSKNIENCEALLDYPKTGGDDVIKKKLS